MTPEDKDDVPDRIDSHAAIDDGVTAQEFNRATVEQAVVLNPMDGDWQSPGEVTAEPRPAFNTWALPHFAAASEKLLRYRQKEAAEDIACLRENFENGKWHALRARESGLAVDPINDVNHRVRDALARQVAHTRRLQRMIGGAMPTEEEKQMIDNVINPPRLTPAQALTLQEAAAKQAERERLGKLGVIPNTRDCITPKMVAIYLGRKERTIERWRADGVGPSYTRIGGRYEYAMSAIEEYIESQTDLAG